MYLLTACSSINSERTQITTLLLWLSLSLPALSARLIVPVDTSTGTYQQPAGKPSVWLLMLISRT